VRIGRGGDRERLAGVTFGLLGLTWALATRARVVSAIAIPPPTATATPSSALRRASVTSPRANAMSAVGLTMLTTLSPGCALSRSVATALAAAAAATSPAASEATANGE
jgi:ABC-type nitrate/sulfonate/bicarbonate transport system permease component